jgi:hypothetical protein
VLLCNQYIISHKAGLVFAQEGDSGAMCYLQLNSQRWGLLNGVLSTSIYSYGIASPIDAVMASFGAGYILLTGTSKI